jgi:hypothetical protein
LLIFHETLDRRDRSTERRGLSVPIDFLEHDA